MTLKIRKAVLSFTIQRLHTTPAQLRGFFANNFKEFSHMHQHHNDEVIYRYPLIQYKIIEQKLVVIGIQSGVELLKMIYEKLDTITISSISYPVLELDLKIKEETFGLSEQFISYKFITPWYALNQANYRKYLNQSKENQIAFLENVLIGNLLSVSKSLEYWVKDKIVCHLQIEKRIIQKTKNHEVYGFLGSFRTNFEIPEYLGLGKSIAKGFGVVELVKVLESKELI